MTIKQNLLPESKFSLKCPYTMTPIGICVHNTANDASAKNEITYMVGNNLETSFHLAVDDIEVWQGLPLDRNGWHAGDGNGEGNRKHIGIEICYSKSGGEKFEKAEQNAVKLIVQLLRKRGWGIDRVKKHQDFSSTKKYCPHRTLDFGWNRFLTMIENELGGTMSNCLVVNDEAGRKQFETLVHNSDVADQTVRYLELGENANNVSFDTVKSSLAAREGKLTTCSTNLSTREAELARANTEITNRIEQVGRLNDQLTEKDKLHKAELDALKSTMPKVDELIKQYTTTIEQLQSNLTEEAKAKGRALNELAETKSKLENALKAQYPDLTLQLWLQLFFTIKWK